MNKDNYDGAIKVLTMQHHLKSRDLQQLQKAKPGIQLPDRERELEEISNGIKVLQALKEWGPKLDALRFSDLESYETAYKNSNVPVLKTPRADGTTALSLYFKNNPKNQILTTFVFDKNGQLIKTE